MIARYESAISIMETPPVQSGSDEKPREPRPKDSADSARTKEHLARYEKLLRRLDECVEEEKAL